MVHLLKLAVGVSDVAQLSVLQRERAETDPPLRHRTRQMPKRADELLDGGSIFWVIARRVQCRQHILDIIPDQRLDGSSCVALVLDPEIVLVDGHAARPFQGWRYLDRDAAPRDLHDGTDMGARMPIALRLALTELCLL